MKIKYTRLHHLQICIPEGEEEKGREFYCNILGLKEIPKPKSLKKTGGFWLEIADIELHIGIEKQNGISKRHPAFEVENITKIKDYLKQKKVTIKDDITLPGINRFSLYDHWQNRIEFIERE